MNNLNTVRRQLVVKPITSDGLHPSYDCFSAVRYYINIFYAGCHGRAANFFQKCHARLNTATIEAASSQLMVQS